MSQIKFQKGSKVIYGEQFLKNTNNPALKIVWHHFKTCKLVCYLYITMTGNSVQDKNIKNNNNKNKKN